MGQQPLPGLQLKGSQRVSDRDFFLKKLNPLLLALKVAELFNVEVK